jgi:hypothetical protein
VTVRTKQLRDARAVVEEVLATLDRRTAFCDACSCLRHRNVDEWQMAEGLRAVARKLDAIALRLEKHDKIG